ncbi:MAG: hypothetical protein OEW64_09730 [Gammaproteobacteria bacterium]|nr:hypothetical protein [Gammaproteobacteria bacterium]MDH5304363.1 hypothetical protein [Gammaproteobacteria bacterium]MDH5322998.1 hypothetical protein [Gammaproteobacteria bacterium]
MKEPNEKQAAEQFSERAKAAFDNSVEQLDAATLSRLNRGRHVALDAVQGNRLAATWGRWLPVTGVAAAALLTMMLVRGPDAVTLPADSVADFEILLESESLEMFENLEFYSWLDSTDLDALGNAG